MYVFPFFTIFLTCMFFLTVFMTHMSIFRKTYHALIVPDLKHVTRFSSQNEKVPWLSIITSPAVWAVIIANFSVDWGLYTILICIPKYFVEILKFDIAKVRNMP